MNQGGTTSRDGQASHCRRCYASQTIEVDGRPLQWRRLSEYPNDACVSRALISLVSLQFNLSYLLYSDEELGFLTHPICGKFRLTVGFMSVSSLQITSTSRPPFMALCVTKGCGCRPLSSRHSTLNDDVDFPGFKAAAAEASRRQSGSRAVAHAQNYSMHHHIIGNCSASFPRCCHSYVTPSISGYVIIR